MQNYFNNVAPIVKRDIFCELQYPNNDLEKKKMEKKSLCFCSREYNVCSSLYMTKHSLCNRYAWSILK